MSRVTLQLVFAGQSAFHVVGGFHHERDSEGRLLREWLGSKDYHGETVEIKGGDAPGRYNIISCGNDCKNTRAACQTLLMEPCKSR